MIRASSYDHRDNSHLVGDQSLYDHHRDYSHLGDVQALIDDHHVDHRDDGHKYDSHRESSLRDSCRPSRDAPLVNSGSIFLPHLSRPSRYHLFFSLVSHPSCVVFRPSCVVSHPSCVVSHLSYLLSPPSCLLSHPSCVLSHPFYVVFHPFYVVSHLTYAPFVATTDVNHVVCLSSLYLRLAIAST